MAAFEQTYRHKKPVFLWQEYRFLFDFEQQTYSATTSKATSTVTSL